MSNSRRSRTLRAIGLFAAGYAVVVLATYVLRADEGAPAESNIPLHVADSRVCAAAAVYGLSTVDDWSQRAAIAQAALNRFDALGHVPNCGSVLTAIVDGGLDTYEWQAALDAVDAIQSGSYHLPLACARADTVLPLSSPAEPPLLRAAAARAQCVIGDLAFVEAR